MSCPILEIHPESPQPRLITQAVAVLEKNGVIVYPTDSGYALGCRLGDRASMERILQIRQIDLSHHLTLVCHDLSELGQYARVDNQQYRLLKSLTPGAYTFILPATKEVPRRTLHPKRATIGLRVPDHNIVQALLRELGEPILSCTLILPDEDAPLNDAHEIQEKIGKRVDLIIDGGACDNVATTVLDISEEGVRLIRQGKGVVPDVL
ncbi:MAG: threonylcarbamoyl-AMP synthase [Hydromonas sp.]|nr:threonylcarbamoyl-AMP synthase [Hydromonas sp.]